MAFDNDIICIGKDGIRTVFRYEIQVSSKDGFAVFLFRIVPENLVFVDWFEFSVTKIDATTGKITSMAHNYVPEYMAKGIPEKMIEEASNILNLEIISSSNKAAHKILGAEWRSIDGGKPWKRLVNQGKATYDTECDIFFFKNP